MTAAVSALRSERDDSLHARGYYQDLAVARTELETYRALLLELDYRRKAGELVHRDVVERIVSRAFAVLVQDLRALPDMIERRHGVTDGKLLGIIDVAVDKVLQTAHDSLGKLLE